MLGKLAEILIGKWSNIEGTLIDMGVENLVVKAEITKPLKSRPPPNIPRIQYIL